MPLTTTSPDISSLDFKVLFDISGATPHIVLTNQSVGSNLAGCTWWYSITTPSNTPIHTGSSTSPDMTGVWAPVTVPDTWPLFSGQIEFSSASTYSVTLYVKDSAGTTFSLNKKALITRPNGNDSGTLGNFGVANVSVEVMCNKSKIFGTDTTNYTYQNKIGTSQTNSWKLVYPMDTDGNIPTPVPVSNSPRVIFDLGYSGDGYQLYLNTYSTYDMTDSVFIKVQYKFRKAFPVYCNIDLCSLTCEIEGMRKQLEKGCGITETSDVRDKLLRIDTLLLQCLIGIAQPLCGIDVPAKIEEIKKIGDFDCCCVGTTGINTTGEAGDITIGLDLTGGGVTGSVSNVGNNFTIHLDVSAATDDLNDVALRGNVSTLALISGILSAAHSSLAPSAISLLNNTDLLIGFDIVSGKPYLKIKGATSGVVSMGAADTTTPYSFNLPASLGLGKLKHTGSGTTIWDSSTGNPSVYIATADAPYTILNGNSLVILNIGITANRLLMLPTGPIDGDIVRVVNFKPFGGGYWTLTGTCVDMDGNAVYTLLSPGVSYEFQYSAAAATWIMIRREGLIKSQSAINGGTVGNAAILALPSGLSGFANAGTGSSVTTADPVANSFTGKITLNTGVGVNGGDVYISVTLALPPTNPSSSKVLVQLCPGNAAAAALSGTKQVYATGETGNKFYIRGGVTGLDDSTTYVWSYKVIG